MLTCSPNRTPFRCRYGEHKAKWENSRRMIRFDNVMSYAHSARTRGETPIPDGGALNYIKWDIHSETAGLSPALTKPTASGNMDPVRMAVWWKVCKHPTSCSDRDLMVMFCGPTAAECAVATGTIDEIDGHPHLYNPRYAGMGYQDALNEYQSHGAADSSIASVYRNYHYIPAEELNNFQKNVRQLVLEPEHPVLGRKVIAIVDYLGGVGKSVLVKSLYHSFPGGVVIFCGSNMTNNLYVLTSWVDAHAGRGPALIIMDLPRSTEKGMDFETIEMVKGVSRTPTPDCTHRSLLLRGRGGLGWEGERELWAYLASPPPRLLRHRLLGPMDEPKIRGQDGEHCLPARSRVHKRNARPSEAISRSLGDVGGGHGHPKRHNCRPQLPAADQGADAAAVRGKGGGSWGQVIVRRSTPYQKRLLGMGLRRAQPHRSWSENETLKRC